MQRNIRQKRAKQFYSWLQRTYGTEVGESLREIAMRNGTIKHVCVKDYIDTLVRMGYMKPTGKTGNVIIYQLNTIPQ